MSDIYVYSDPHFGHEKCCTTFKRVDNSPLRHFKNAREMNEAFVERWNAVVRPSDKCYIIGDVVMKEEHGEIVKRLNGHKRLIGGNHDIFRAKFYLSIGFEDIRGVRVFRDKAEGVGDCVLTHVPVHPSCLERWKINVHGHLHCNVVMQEVVRDGVLYTEPDPRYVNVSVEQINYTPLLLTEALKLAGKQTNLPAFT